MKKNLKKSIVAGLLILGLTAYSQDVSAAGIAKPSDVQHEAEFKVLGVKGRTTSNGFVNTGGTIDNCGLFDGKPNDSWTTPSEMYWYEEGNYLEIDIKEDCNIWRSGTKTWDYSNAPLIISRWDGTKYNDITSTITQITTGISNFQWEKTRSNLQAGRYRFDAAGVEPFRLDSEWYIEATQIPSTDQNVLKVVLEPEEELQLSIDEDLTKNTVFTWESSNPEVAAVDNNGIVTALKTGNTVIAVRNEDGSYQGSINILVVDDADDYRLAVDLRVSESRRLTIDDYTFSKKIT